MNFWKRPNLHSTRILPLIHFLGRGHALGLTIGPPPLLTALGRGQNWAPDPASSAGAQGKDVPFREDIVEI